MKIAFDPKTYEKVTKIVDAVYKDAFIAGAIAMREKCIPLADSSGQQIAIQMIDIYKLLSENSKKD